MSGSSAACPLCLSERQGRLEPDKTWHSGFRGRAELVRCVDCTLIYLRGYESDAVETRSDDYVRAKIVDSCNQLGEQDQLFVRRLQWAAGRVQSKRVLDIGCGNGAFLLSAREMGWEPLGLDKSEAARDLLASSGIDVHLDDAPDFLRNRPQSFDFIHMNHSLEHIPNAPETVLAAREALAPHGLLYVEVPNEFDNLLYRLLEVLGRKRRTGSIFGTSKPPREPSPHLYFFNPESMTRLARRAGFTSFEVHARRREPLQLDASEVLSNLAARLGAGPFLTLIAQA